MTCRAAQRTRAEQAGAGKGSIHAGPCLTARTCFCTPTIAWSWRMMCCSRKSKPAISLWIWEACWCSVAPLPLTAWLPPARWNPAAAAAAPGSACGLAATSGRAAAGPGARCRRLLDEVRGSSRGWPLPPGLAPACTTPCVEPRAEGAAVPVAVAAAVVPPQMLSTRRAVSWMAPAEMCCSSRTVRSLSAHRWSTLLSLDDRSVYVRSMEPSRTATSASSRSSAALLGSWPPNAFAGTTELRAVMLLLALVSWCCCCSAPCCCCSAAACGITAAGSDGAPAPPPLEESAVLVDTATMALSVALTRASSSRICARSTESEPSLMPSCTAGVRESCSTIEQHRKQQQLAAETAIVGAASLSSRAGRTERAGRTLDMRARQKSEAGQWRTSRAPPMEEERGCCVHQRATYEQGARCSVPAASWTGLASPGSSPCRAAPALTPGPRCCCCWKS